MMDIYLYFIAKAYKAILMEFPTNRTKLPIIQICFNKTLNNIEIFMKETVCSHVD